MKTLKFQILPIMLILSSTFFYAQKQSKLTLSNFQDIYNANALIMNLEGEIITKNWNKDYVLIQMEIRANDVSLEVAKYLVSKERFCLRLLPLEDGSLVLYMPNFQLPVYINGQRLAEDISYQVFVPENITVKVRTMESILPCMPERGSMAKFADDVDDAVSKPAIEKKQNKTSL